MKKIINNLKKINMTDILIAFILLQPFCDIYMGVIGEKWDVFGISLATIFRSFMVCTMFIAVVIKQIRLKLHLKRLKIMFVYLLLIVTYFILHHFNIQINGNYFVDNGLYNAGLELNYILRLCLPIMLIYVVSIIKPNKDRIFKAIIITAVIVSSVIIITNIFKISYTSYSKEEYNTTITSNIFNWFTNNKLDYKESLSKGWFVSANQIGALLAIIFPVVVYTMLQKQKWYMDLAVIIQVIAMIIIGTRVATLGWILSVVISIIVYLINVFLEKERALKFMTLASIVITFIIGISLTAISPVNNRDFASSYQDIYEETLEERKKDENYIELEAFKSLLNNEKELKKYLKIKDNKKLSLEELQYKAKLKYIEENYVLHYISKIYINKIYPYTDDPDFWLEVFEKPLSLKGDNRGRQSLIIERIKEENNNIVLDTILGLGATPLNIRGYMIENDILSHYYNIGIFGMLIFIIPYVAIVIYGIIKSIKEFTHIFNYNLLIPITSIILAFGIGFFAGHVLDEYIISIYLAVIAGILFNFSDNNRELENEK